MFYGGYFVDSLWFSFDTVATYGIDPGLCEFEIPQWPPVNMCDFHPAFVDLPGRSALGNGTWLDYRGYYDRARADTHRIRFPALSAQCYPMVVRWSCASILAMCDSARIVDEPTGSRYNINLAEMDSMNITDASVTSFWLYRHGAKRLTVDVDPPGGQVPTSRQFFENYPNPFNPVTRIRFDLPNNAKISLRIYNLLGQEVATLVDEQKQPGRYEVQWNAGSFPSGIYFCRLQARDFVQTNKFILSK